MLLLPDSKCLPLRQCEPQPQGATVVAKGLGLGVAILFRHDTLAAAKHTCRAINNKVTCSLDGRLLAVNFYWAGHNLALASVYPWSLAWEEQRTFPTGAWASSRGLCKGGPVAKDENLRLCWGRGLCRGLSWPWSCRAQSPLPEASPPLAFSQSCYYRPL